MIASKRILLASFFLAATIASSLGVAQSLKPGEWRTYTSMRSVSDIAITSDSSSVWAATNGGVFRADLRNAQTPLQALRTTDGLTENDVTAVATDGQGNVYFGEGTGGFDIYSSSSAAITRQSDIRSNPDYTNKAINGITVVGSTVYLATGYGISVFLAQKGVFGATATQFASLPQQDSVRQIIDDGSFVYAAMHEGVVWARNTADLHASISWTFLPNAGGSVRALALFNGKIYAGAENGLFVLSPARDTLLQVPLQNSLAINRLLSANDSLYILDESGVLYSTNDLVHLASHTVSANAGDILTAIAFRPNNGVIAGSNLNGILFSEDGSLQNNIYPPGPIVNNTNFLHFATDRLYVTNQTSGFGIFQPDTDAWQDFAGGEGATPPVNFSKVLYDSVRGVTWFSTFGNPLYKVTGLTSGQPIWEGFTTQNNLPSEDGGHFLVTSGMILDDSGNFLVTSWAANGQGLSKLASDGEHFINYSLAAPGLLPWGCVTQDMNGNYWVGTEAHNEPHSTGVYWLRASDGSYQSNVIYGGSSGTLGTPLEGTESVNAVLTDQDDGIWCGTKGGVEIISNPDAILQDNNPRFSIRTVQFTTSQVVHTMAVDGVGNKWIGTENGIFVVSPDGSDSVAHFTTENSPLVDNTVVALAIDPNRGEAYAGTPSGISRFSTIFKQGRPDYTSIRVFPNPVVQSAGASPTVYIDGLVAGSTVQIFSLAGQLVTTINGTLLGSTVTWNGRDALGRQVPSGMYLVSATSPQSGGNGEAKVIIVRKPSN